MSIKEQSVTQNDGALQDVLPSLPSASSLFGSALSFYKIHWKMLAVLAAMPVVWEILGILFGNINPVFDILFVVGNFLLTALLGLALILFLKEKKNDLSEIGVLYRNAFALLAPYTWVTFLDSLASLGGFILLIVPGIIISMLLIFSGYAFLFEEHRGMEALVVSWHYVKGFWGAVLWRVIFLGFLFFLIQTALFTVLAGIIYFISGETLQFINQFSATQIEAIGVWASRGIALGNSILLSFFFTPFSVLYFYFIFEFLRNAKAKTPMSGEETKQLKKKIILFAVLGVVGLILFLAIAGWVIIYFFNRVGAN